VDLETAVPSPDPAELASFDAEGVSVRLCSDAAEDLDELHRWLSRSFKCGETAVDQDSLEFTVWVDQAPPQATGA
jgi:hypothetical protein